MEQDELVTRNRPRGKGRALARKAAQRRLLRRRHVQNWLWITILALSGVAVIHPHWAFANHRIDDLLDTLGGLVLLCGIAIRICARGWKYETCERKRLVTDGPYGYVRHPLYLGSFLIGLGLCAIVADPILSALYALYFWVSHFRAIRTEEANLARRWPGEVTTYRKGVSALLPRWSAFRRCGPVLPRDLPGAVAREADAVCVWPLMAVAVELWEEGTMDPGLHHHAILVTLSVVLAVVLGSVWVLLKRQYAFAGDRSSKTG